MSTRISGIDRLDSNDLQLAGLGTALGFAFAIFACISKVWRGSWLLITTYIVPFAVYLLIIGWLFRKSHPPASTATRMIILCMSLTYHVMMLFTPQPLSNDIYRYYWDGKIQSAGINPYSYPPAAEELRAYRDEYWLRLYNREVPTGYPPLSEGLFGLAYHLYPHPWTNRLFSVIASIGTVFFLMSALRKSAGNERMALIYAWSPLVAMEFGNSGHLDSFGIYFISAALAMNLSRKPLLTALSLASGGLIKFIPIILAPLWGQRWKSWIWLVFISVFTIPIILLLPGGTPVKGVTYFASHGDFNSSLYRLFEFAWSWIFDFDTAIIAGRILFAAVLIIGYIYLLRTSDPQSALSGWRAARKWLGLALMFSPVFHPWYICWMLAFVCLDFSLPWVILSGTMIFARHIYIQFDQTGIWQEAGWVAFAVYVPFYISLLLPLIQRYRDRRHLLSRSIKLL